MPKMTDAIKLAIFSFLFGILRNGKPTRPIHETAKITVKITAKNTDKNPFSGYVIGENLPEHIFSLSELEEKVN